MKRYFQILFDLLLIGKSSMLSRLVLTVCFLFLFHSFSFSQTWIMPVDGKVYANGQKLIGAIITLYKNGQQQQQVVTTANGKFSFELPPNAEYIIAITKPGYITKKFKINTANVPADRAEAGGFNIFQPDVALFEMPSAPEISKRVEAILSQPIAIYQFVPAESNFNYDEKYTQAMQDKLAELADLQKKVEKEMQEKTKNAALEAQKQLEIDKQYKAAITKGDNALSSRDYAVAKAGYTEAGGIKPAEQYPKTKLAEIDKLLADAGKQKELDAKYQAAITKGDNALAGKDYTTAKAGYTEAGGIKPAEQYPKTKLAEIDKLFAEAGKQKELDAKYQAAITKGDNALAGKDYATAKAGYTEAGGIKPTEQYPKTKLAEIDKLLADAGKQKELDAKYQAAITKGDNALAGKDYTAAKAGYTEASGIKPAEQYPKTKLAEIDKILSSLEAEKQKEQQYKDLVAKADQSLASKDYAGAKSSYTQALGIKPAEQYPKSKIAEIDKILAEMSKAGELEKQYKDLVAKGDNFLIQKNYTSARSSYSDASSLKPAEQYPKTKIAEIDKILADLASQKSAAEKDQQYKNAIAKGDKAFAVKDYSAAKTGYTEALGIKPAELYPKQKLGEIDKLLSAANSQKETDEKYKAAVTKGDAAFSSKDYTSAQTAYLDASSLKPAEQYPKNKLTEIDKLLAASEINKQKEQHYKELIEKGDQQFAAKDYTNAKSSYSQALGIKSDPYPKAKIAEIDKLLKDLAAQSSVNKAEEDYKAAIMRGDAAFKEKAFANAKLAYSEALTYKPNEQYPKNKLAEIEKIENDQALASQQQQERDLKYNQTIAKADQLFKSKSYVPAKSTYLEASSIKPQEKYPKDKIKQIEDILKGSQMVAQTVVKKEGPKQTVPVQTEEEKKKAYQSALRSKYPNGVTEEEYTDNGKTILRRVVIREDYAGVYTKVTHNWGGVYCFKDNTPITEISFENETR